MKNQQGFTIIELIVVIAIIAVLAGIVISNVVQYEKRGKDAAIKAQISEIRTAGTDFFSNNGNYTNMCASGTGCYNVLSNITGLGGSLVSHPYIGSNSYCIDFYLSDGATKWCVDNTDYEGSTDNCTNLHVGCN